MSTLSGVAKLSTPDSQTFASGHLGMPAFARRKCASTLALTHEWQLGHGGSSPPLRCVESPISVLVIVCLPAVKIPLTCKDARHQISIWMPMVHIELLCHGWSLFSACSLAETQSISSSPFFSEKKCRCPLQLHTCLVLCCGHPQRPQRNAPCSWIPAQRPLA